MFCGILILINNKEREENTMTTEYSISKYEIKKVEYKGLDSHSVYESESA